MKASRARWDLYATMDKCRECKGPKRVVLPPLAECVLPTGSLKSPLMFVGQSPGVDEVGQGAPFVGRSGKLLNDLLGILGMDRREVYVTNAIKCHPPGNRGVHPVELARCRHFLKAEILKVKPRVLVLLGREAYRIIGDRVDFAHKVCIRRMKPRIVLSYHPSYFLRKGDPEAFYELAPCIEAMMR